MQHDYSKMTQRIFATLFGLFALVGPVIGVTYSDNFGIRSEIIAKQTRKLGFSEADLDAHERFFCASWAGACNEQRLMRDIKKLIN